MFEYILFSTIWATSIQPELGRFKTLQECQYVGQIYVKDQFFKEDWKDNMKRIHCIKVSK